MRRPTPDWGGFAAVCGSSLAILGGKLPQALMAGNTLVVKPSANAALAPTISLHRIAGLLTPGVVNIVTDMIADPRARGANVLELGPVPDPDLYAQGYFQSSTLVIDAEPMLSVVREEQFGLMLPILTFDTEDDAVALANDDQFGLALSVWSADTERAIALARRIEAGYTFINAHGPAANDGNAPFGGFRTSGIGRDFGYEGVTQFQGLHSIAGTSGLLG